MELWSKIPFIIIALVLVLLPFLLAFPTPEFNLAYLLFSAVALLLFYDLVNLGQQKKIIINTSPFTQGVILLLLSFLISTILAPNKAASLLSPLGLGILIVLSIWYVILSNILSIKKFSILLKISFVTGVIFSIFVILDNLSVFKLLPIPSFWLVQNQIPESPAFGGFPGMTGGGEFLSFLLPVLVVLGYYLYGLFKKKGYIPCHSRVYPVRAGGNLYNNNSMDPPVKLEDDRLREIILVISFFLLLTASLLLLPFPASVKTSNGTPSSTFSTLSTCSTCVLPYQSGWSISLDSLKQPKSAIAGYGVGNFPVAFNLNRPLGLNSAFSRSSNFLLHFMTENGLLGVLAFLYLLFLAFKETKTWFLTKRVADAEDLTLPSPIRRGDTRGEVFLGFWSTVLLMLIFPPNLILLFYFFTFLGLINLTSPLPSPNRRGSTEGEVKTYDLANLENTIWIVCATLIFLISLTVYLAGQTYLAEFNYQKALFAISKNAKVGPVYKLLKSATDLNPYLPRYHQTLSQTMLFWGISLTKKDNISDKDRQDATILIQQAISQAQQAISLNPRDAGAWQNLGEIYRNLVSAVNGADSWAISAFSQAVILDPNNPYAHFSLASILSQLSQWENSQRQLEIAVSLSPNFANGFYNLSYVQKQQGLYSSALNSLNQAISLLPDKSSDKQKALSEKSALEKLVPQAISPSSTSSTFTTPSTSSGELSPKLQLPESSSPPAHFKP